ncbi:MAG: phosphate acyltransferase PlsX [Gemmatimonadota bacterium]
MTIALDAMGGDGAPATPVEGARAALAEASEDVRIVLVGDPQAIDLAVSGGLPVRALTVLPARETIGPDEPPALAVRRKRESSIVVGLEALRRGEVDAFISAGSTGAIMAASLLVLGPLPGVERPSVGAMFPTSEGSALVLDAGANVNCRPDQLRQFAHLGSIYVRDLLRIERPRVGLLNVGEEEEKGDDLAIATYRLLAADPALNFIGNVEGHQIILGACDVLVCDGFVGNALLKFYESMAGFVLGILRQRLEDAPGDLEDVFKFLDYTEYGGAPLLGVNGVSIICHGSSPPRAIKNAIEVAVRSLRSGMVEDMARDLEQLPDLSA